MQVAVHVAVLDDLPDRVLVSHFAFANDALITLTCGASGSSSPIRHRSITFCALKISLRSVALSLTMRM
jgi:hypothetical protein